MFKNNKRKGFTLVEVLTVLFIIGVIAAFAAILLNTTTKFKRVSVEFKTAVSTLNQAEIASLAKFPYEAWFYAIQNESDPQTCATDLLEKGDSTMCAIFNTSLANANFLGVYGTTAGLRPNTLYTFAAKTINPENFLLYALADGTYIGFNPNAKGCYLEQGDYITKEKLESESGLKNCIGFIDVNGPNLPNKEYTCAKASDTALNPLEPCPISKKTKGDVFPIVFYNSTIEPASNVGKSIMH